MVLHCKLALSVNPQLVNEELFADCARAGIEALELSPSREEEAVFDYEEVCRLAEKYGVRLWSFHLPFVPFERDDIANPAIAERTVEQFKYYIKKASDIGIKVFVIHPSMDPVEDDVRAVWMEQAKKSLRELAEFALPLECTIAVENLPRKCLGNTYAEVLELVGAHEALKVCFDTNHLLKEKLTDFIGAVGDKILTTHISDYDYINERHWLPGEGKVDWQEVVDAFASAGYDGYWLYEVDFDAPWSIDRPRDLNCADYRRNFTEIMENKPLTRIGTPKQKLGMWKVLE